MQPPRDIIYHKIAHTLEVKWPNESYQLPAELLRVYSPSAEGCGATHRMNANCKPARNT